MDHIAEIVNAVELFVRMLDPRLFLSFIIICPTNHTIDQIYKILRPYITIQTVVGCITCVQMLKCAFLCSGIRKTRTTDGFSIVPFIGSLMITHLRFIDEIFNDTAMSRINILGLVWSIVSITIYYHYTPDKEERIVRSHIRSCGLLVAIIIAIIAIFTLRYGKLMAAFLFGFLILYFLSDGGEAGQETRRYGIQMTGYYNRRKFWSVPDETEDDTDCTCCNNEDSDSSSSYWDYEEEENYFGHNDTVL